MKALFVVGGLALILGGLALGFYVGVWLLLVGGFVEVMNAVIGAFKGVDLNVSVIAWGLVKMFFAGIAGWLSAIILIVPGFGMVAGALSVR